MGREFTRKWFTESGRECYRGLINAKISFDEQRINQAGFFTSLCITTETYMGRLLSDAVQESGLLGISLGSELIQAYQAEFTRSWNSRLTWLEKSFGIKVKGMPLTQKMGLLNELRNSVMHGDLRLTDYQVSGTNKLIALRRGLFEVLEIHTVGRKLVPGPGSTDKAFVVAADFVNFLESLLFSADIDYR